MELDSLRFFLLRLDLDIVGLVEALSFSLFSLFSFCSEGLVAAISVLGELWVKLRWTLSV